MEDPANRPPGDLLEELLKRGPANFPLYARRYVACQTANRAAILLGGLAFGQAVLEPLAEWATRPDSAEKWALMTGLAAMGHPETEGYFLRYLREGRPERQTVVALESLALIKSVKAREFCLKFLDEPFLMAAAANALVALDPQAAGEALLPHTERWEAVDALSRTGFKGARPLFLRLLGSGEPMDVAAVHGLAKIGETEDAERLALLISSKNPDLSRAAFEGYAGMGAPLGPEPLLKAARAGLKPWMAEGLGACGGAEGFELLLDSVDFAPSKSLLKKMIFWKEEAKADPTKIYEALRGAEGEKTLARILGKVKSAPGSHELRPLLKIKALYSQKSAENDLLELFKGQDAAISYLVADGWLDNPSREFLIAAARVLRKPGFTEMDSLSAIMDPQHLIESRSREINPCLLVGSFLDSGFIDLFAFVSTLRSRFSAKKFPAAPSPSARFGSMSEGGFAPFIEAVAAANTALREELSRIWEVLLDATDEGSPVFEIFWAETGLHRGGLQRMILRRLPAAVEAWTDGRDDKFLGELDAVESTIPRDGPLAARVLEVFRGARMKLKRECKDMVVWMEGGQRGDIVLIEKL